MTLDEGLERLNALKAQGNITEEEYASLRKRVIEGFPMTQGVVVYLYSERSSECSLDYVKYP